MIEKREYNGQDFKAVLDFESWRIGVLNYSQRFSSFDRLERHFLTDEAFILLCGNAVLYTDSEQVQMEIGVVYNVPKGEWHHVVVSKDAKILIVENSNTNDKNTEIKFI